jgi:hypothetical protein
MARECVVDVDNWKLCNNNHCSSPSQSRVTLGRNLTSSPTHPLTPSLNLVFMRAIASLI